MKQKMFLGITLFGIALAIYKYSAGQANFALITFAFLNTLFSAFLLLHRITKYSFLSFLDIYYIFSYVFFGLANMLTSSKGYLSLRTYIIANAIVFISNLSFALFSAFNIKKRTTLKMYKISSVSIMSFVFVGTILLLFVYVLLINRYGFAIYRSGYIGGLEIAAILGVSKYTGMLIDTSFRSLNLINIFLNNAI